jgi:hypothetical protein
MQSFCKSCSTQYLSARYTDSGGSDKLRLAVYFLVNTTLWQHLLFVNMIFEYGLHPWEFR